MNWMRLMCSCVLLAPAADMAAEEPPPLPWIRIAKDGRTFVEDSTGRRFTPWGFNYDHDEKGALLEDYWEAGWPRVEEDFKEMKDLGANRRRLDRLLLGQDARGTAALEHNRRRDHAAVAEVLRKEEERLRSATPSRTHPAGASVVRLRFRA